MEPSPTESEPRAVERVAPRGEDSHAGPVLGYAARVTGARRLWRWIRPGSVLFFVGVAVLAVGAGWGAWKWRLAADRKAFEACATIYSTGPSRTNVTFTHAPTHGALRHLARLPGPFILTMRWPESENDAAAQAFGGADLHNVSAIEMLEEINADLLLKRLIRPDVGLKALTGLKLDGTKVTDAGLKELSRPNSGLNALTALNLGRTDVTDAGLKELTRPDCGLKALTGLHLNNTKITDAGVKELTHPDSGLKAMTALGLVGTKVTDAGINALQAARPGLRIYR